jgi:hypothetical protein
VSGHGRVVIGTLGWEKSEHLLAFVSSLFFFFFSLFASSFCKRQNERNEAINLKEKSIVSFHAALRPLVRILPAAPRL